MRLSITGRLVAMFAATTLIAFGLVGAALYQVLASELDRHQLEELRTDLQNLQYSIERTGTLDRWARVQTKMDTLTPTDGRVRFWVMSDDPRFQYGKGLSALITQKRTRPSVGVSVSSLVCTRAQRSSVPVRSIEYCRFCRSVRSSSS